MSVTFSGDQGRQIEQTVIELLQTYLATQIAADPYLTYLSKWNGAEVVYTDKDWEKFIASAKPFIFVNIMDGSHKRQLHRQIVNGTFYFGTRHTIGVMLQIMVTDRCRNAIEPLRDAVSNIIDTGYFDLDAIGLEATNIKPSSSHGAGIQLFNPHTVMVTAFTVPM